MKLILILVSTLHGIGWQRHDIDEGAVAGDEVDRPEPDGGRDPGVGHGVRLERRRHHRLPGVPHHDEEEELRS